MDLEIFDKLITGASIDTERATNAYNRLLFKEVPINLLPAKYQV